MKRNYGTGSLPHRYVPFWTRLGKLVFWSCLFSSLLSCRCMLGSLKGCSRVTKKALSRDTAPGTLSCPTPEPTSETAFRCIFLIWLYYIIWLAAVWYHWLQRSFRLRQAHILVYMPVLYPFIPSVGRPSSQQAVQTYPEYRTQLTWPFKREHSHNVLRHLWFRLRTN
ncbi:hypothetical protein LZ31DRAFT_21688 [Colletotrichum somersetense]|nr:hypothetical protein LZ31DRAFT_21688 [Colletotrichum somersetense]